jgi:hypothetical protein
LSIPAEVTRLADVADEFARVPRHDPIRGIAGRSPAAALIGDRIAIDARGADRHTAAERRRGDRNVTSRFVDGAAEWRRAHLAAAGLLARDERPRLGRPGSLTLGPVARLDAGLAAQILAARDGLVAAARLEARGAGRRDVERGAAAKCLVHVAGRGNLGIIAAQQRQHE